MRYGRLPANQAALERAPSRRFGAVKPPPSVPRPDFAPGLWQNDTLPDCTAVGLANAASGIAARNGFQLNIWPACPPAFYAACVGVQATMAALAATNGAVMLDVLERQRTRGFDIGPQTLYGEHATTLMDRTSLAGAIAELGAGYWGVDIYEADEEAATLDTLVPSGSFVGGHCLVGFGYSGLGDDDLVDIATWGGWQRATWRWVDSRIREAHVLTWRQIAKTDGSEWNGGDFSTLEAERLALTA